MADEVPFLYHYTSLEGLTGILPTRQIWATDILYLNDSAEFSFTINLLYRILKENFHVEEDFNNFFTFLVSTYGTTGIPSFPPYYVTAFSEVPDDLSQWRGFCPPNGGFSIEFDKKKLDSYVKSKGYMLQKCIYYKADAHANLLEKLAEEINKKLDPRQYVTAIFRKEEGKQAFIELFERIGELASYIKDPNFYQEKEWRIIIKPTENNRDTVHYRELHSLLIPYFEMEPMKAGCISKIVVGPCPHMDLSCRSVRSFVNAKLGLKLRVEKSIIPYRNL